jgi:aminocarboxymuconate-semialdehyde decarboxylase
MLKIDTHTHIIPKDLPKFKDKFGYGGFIHLDHHKDGCAKMMKDDEFFREIEDNTWSPKRRMKDCDADDVDVQVLSTIPVMFSYWAKPKDALTVSQFLNDHIAGVVDEYPHRFAGLGTLPMQDPDLAVQELERCINDLGLAGIEIGTHVNEWDLDAPQVVQVLEAAEDLGAAVFVHPWDMMGKEDMPQYWLPWLVGMPAETSRAICSLIFGGVFEKLPDLRVIFAHGGGSFPQTIGRIEWGFKVRPDLCQVNNDVNPREYLGHFYLDSLVHDRKVLDYIVDLVGSDKIALGSDYPFPLGEHHPGRLIESTDYSDKVKANLLHNAALEWLGLEKARFVEGATTEKQAEK